MLRPSVVVCLYGTLSSVDKRGVRTLPPRAEVTIDSVYEVVNDLMRNRLVPK